MTQQIINIGVAPDDGTGDPLRTSFNKTNQNFTELYGRSSGGAPVGAEYITSTADATLTAERVLTDTATVTWDRTTAGQIKANAAGGGNVSNSGTPTAGQIAQWTDATHIQGVAAPTGPPQGRLTLQTATPVMTTTQAAKTTIYFSPYAGSLCPIYDGTNFSMMTFAELSALTTDTTKSPAAIGVSKINDWFVWNDAGTLRLGHGVDWTNDITPVGSGSRPGLTMVAGIWTNQAAITNGPAINRGTYVGTTRSNASSQLDWIYGAIAAGGTAGWFGVWNAYNRIDVSTMVGDTATTWVYNAVAVRAANNSNNMRVSAVFGLAEHLVSAVYQCGCVSVAGGNAAVGIGYNVINAFSGAYSTMQSTTWVQTFSRFDTIPFGFNFWQAAESSSAVSTGGTFGGQNVGFWQNGLFFNARM